MRLLVDISGLIYRAAYKMAGLSHRGLNTGAVFGTLRSLGNLAEAHEATEMAVAWDCGHASRSALYPEYKTNRKREPEFVADLERQKVVLRNLLDCLPIVNIELPGVEADDCIAVVAKFAHLEQVGIVTGDKDLYQLAAPPLHRIIAPGGGLVDLDLEPRQYLTYKVLVGDPSDNIKGVQGIGDKRALALIRKCGTLRQIMEALRTGEVAGVRMGHPAYEEAARVVSRNLKLMRLGYLLTTTEHKQILDQYCHGRLDLSIDEPRLRRGLLASGFSSLVGRLSGFLAPFRAMERHKHHAKAETEKNQGPDRPGSRVAGSDHREGGGWTRIVRVVERRGGEDRTLHAGEVRGGGRAAVGSGASGRRAFDPSLAAAVASRLRKAQALGVAPQGPGRSPARAVRPATPSGEPRSRRAGTPASPVFHDAEVLRRQHQRRGAAMSVLRTLQTDDGWEWLKRQPTRRLRTITTIIDNVEEDSAYKLTVAEMELLEHLHREYTTELPEWMR